MKECSDTPPSSAPFPPFRADLKALELFRLGLPFAARGLSEGPEAFRRGRRGGVDGGPKLGLTLGGLGGPPAYWLYHFHFPL